jgi:hypothetical protein
MCHLFLLAFVHFKSMIYLFFVETIRKATVDCEQLLLVNVVSLSIHKNIFFHIYRNAHP